MFASLDYWIMIPSKEEIRDLFEKAAKVGLDTAGHGFNVERDLENFFLLGEVPSYIREWERNHER